MFKGEPAIHYGHNAQTIKVVEVTMQNLLPLGVWSQWALRTEMALPQPPPWLRYLFLFFVQTTHSSEANCPHGFQKFTGSTMLSPDTAVFFASKARNSMDGNCVTCTPAFFFIMPVGNISNWLCHFLLFERGCYKQGIVSHQLNFMHKGKTLVNLNAQEWSITLDLIFLKVPMSTN